jgi:hypothetical protein
MHNYIWFGRPIRFNCQLSIVNYSLTKLVGEHCCRRRRYVVRGVGAATKADVGMSNDKESEKLSRRKTEGS